MLSLCVSLGADNCCSDLRWTALESEGSCLLLYWGMCLLCCRDEGPRILDILPFSLPPPPPAPTISFRHSDCLLRLGFFFLVLLFPLSDSLWQRSFIHAYIAYLYPPFLLYLFIESKHSVYLSLITQVLFWLQNSKFPIYSLHFMMTPCDICSHTHVFPHHQLNLCLSQAIPHM